MKNVLGRDKMNYLEIVENDSPEEMKNKSAHNLNRLKILGTSLRHDFQYTDMSNGDRKRFKEWVVNLFLEDK